MTKSETQLFYETGLQLVKFSSIVYVSHRGQLWRKGCICGIFKQKLGSCYSVYSKYKVSALLLFYFYDMSSDKKITSFQLTDEWAFEPCKCIFHLNFIFLYYFKWNWFCCPQYKPHRFHLDGGKRTFICSVSIYILKE